MGSSTEVAILERVQAQGIYSQHDGQKGNWGPNVAILMPMQEPKSEFSLNKLVVAELKILSGSALLPVQDVVHGRPNLKFGLHFGDMGESDLYTVGKEEFLRKEVVGSQVEPHK